MTTVIVQLPQWLARSHNLASRELTGTITRATQRGIQFAGHANVRAAVNCLRCGRPLEHATSRAVGYGPDCSDLLGIPRDLTDDQIDAVRKQLERDTHVEVWLPRSKVVVFDPDTGERDPLPEVEAQPEPTSTVVVDGDHIVLKTEFMLKELAKSVPSARWRGKDKAWVYPTSPSVAAAIVSVWGDRPLQRDKLFDQLLADDAAAGDAQAIKQQDEDQLHPIPRTATEPWRHQLRGYHWGMQVKTPMYAIEMGGGKSKILVDLIVNSGAMLSLIICPNNVQRVWPKQFRIHAGTDVEVFTFKDAKGTIAKRVEKAKQAHRVARARGIPFVLVINYEAAWRDAFAKFALSTIWDFVALDESHRVKKPGGKWSLFAAKLRKVSKMRACLTGTPLGNSPLDIYGQYRFLDPGIFGTSFHAFKQRYAVMGGYGDHQVIAYKMNPKMRDKRTGREVDNPHYDPAVDKEFHDKLYRLAFRVGEEVLDLPPFVDVEIPVELTPKGRKFYDTLTEEWIAQDAESGGVFTARNVLTRMLRQQQITGGSVNDDDGNNVQVDDAKETAFSDFLEDLPPNEPLVVFCRFVHDLNVIARQAEKHGLRYGELSGRRNDALTDDATMSPDIDVAAVQIQSGGVGIDLTRARYAMYYSLSSSLIEYDQSRKRVRRPGQERPVTYLHMVAQDTVDEKVYFALSNKREVVDYLLLEKEH